MFNLRIPSFKKIVVLSLVALVLPLLTLFWQTTTAFSQETTQAEIVVRDRGGIAVNQVNFNRVEYVGQCSGLVYVPSELRAQFVSNTTPPASGRRAIVRNVTKGINSNPYPFTDREYSQGRYSEGFDIQIGYEHNQRDFSVIVGENQLEYEIKESNGNIIERGTFPIQVSVNDQGIFAREAICREEWNCTEEQHGDRKDRICHPLRTCQCP
jgi:hypothetical protein